MNKETYAILVIDDEESIRRLLQNELANSCREIHTAADTLGISRKTLYRKLSQYAIE